MITHVLIHNFRGFLNFQIELGRVVYLMGRNGCGKSSFADAIYGLVMVIDSGELTPFFEADSRNRFQSFDTQRFELGVQRGGYSYLYSLELRYPEPKADPEVVCETLDCGGERVFAFENGHLSIGSIQGLSQGKIAYDQSKGGLASIAASTDLRVEAFQDWASEFMLVRLNPYEVEAIARKAADSLNCDGSNFAAWYETVSNADTEAQFRYFQSIRNVIPGFRNLNLTKVSRHGKAMEVAFEGMRRGDAFSLTELSDGQIALLVYYAISHFAFRNSGTVFLDEPDNFIALSEIEPLLDELEEAVEANQAQVLLISHHPDIANRWGRIPGRCLHFKRKIDGTFVAQDTNWDEFGGLSVAEVVARGWEDA